MKMISAEVWSTSSQVTVSKSTLQGKGKRMLKKEVNNLDFFFSDLL